MKPQRVLAVVAHPDDESLFMGGTLALHAKAGDDVHVLVLADGVSSRGSDGLRRLKHFALACRALGVTGEMTRCFEDQQSDQVPQLEINRQVELHVRARPPQIVYTHYLGDVNLDHRRTAEAVLVATRGVCAVRCCEPEWPTRSLLGYFPATERFDIETTLTRKMKACAAYRDELRPYPHPRSLKALRAKRVETFVYAE